MKRKKLGLVHTSATLVPVFAALCKEKLPNVDVFNIADDSLVKGIRQAAASRRKSRVGWLAIWNPPSWRARITSWSRVRPSGRRWKRARN